MRAFVAFFKKELLERIRTGKLLMLFAVFAAFGILNPATAKLTPWLMEAFAESLSQSGLTITAYEITAFDSWVQFFKNLPIALIVFVLAECGAFTKEYSSNTLVLCLTKGLSRPKVLFVKALHTLLLWTVLYFTCFGITYAYTAYFWDNSVICELTFPVFAWYLLGVLAVMITVLFSSLLTSNTGVAFGVAAVLGISYLLGFIPRLKEYVPTFLMKTSPLMYGTSDIGEYAASVLITVALSLSALAASVFIFNEKQL